MKFLLTPPASRLATKRGNPAGCLLDPLRQSPVNLDRSVTPFGVSIDHKLDRGSRFQLEGSTPAPQPIPVPSESHHRWCGTVRGASRRVSLFGRRTHVGLDQGYDW